MAVDTGRKIWMRRVGASRPDRCESSAASVGAALHMLQWSHGCAAGGEEPSGAGSTGGAASLWQMTENGSVDVAEPNGATAHSTACRAIARIAIMPIVRLTACRICPDCPQTPRLSAIMI